MNSSRPYLIRAMHEWIMDNELTPYVLVDANHGDTVIPREFVEDNKILLNVSPSAIQNLHLGNDFVMFSARFHGKAMEVSFPVSAVLAVYAKENGRGMMFNESDTDPSNDPSPSNPSPKNTVSTGSTSSGAVKGGKPSLKIVK